jgi:glycosyltransferase involved in cell wall biosynthesis
LTVSHTVKKEIALRFKINSKRILVIYNGLSKVFLEQEPQIHKVEDPKKYLLSVSSLNPRKNLNNLIRAFLQLEDKSLKLLIIGKINRNFNQEKLTTSDRIEFLHDISDEELRMYYANAQLFVYPSLYEGFGIPIIESLSQGVPVCVSDIPVFREICGDKVSYFDPYDIKDMSEKIQDSLRYGNRKKILFDDYNWANSAKKLLAILNLEEP